ncbi:MAG: TerB family tellurite resistance protein [Paludibacteraceae bacterium]|nr:TerB family tellurite resistance protein [Paludibacteraceae bacterium]
MDNKNNNAGCNILFIWATIFIGILTYAGSTGDLKTSNVVGGIALFLMLCFFRWGYSTMTDDDSEQKYAETVLMLLSVVMNANRENKVCELDQVKRTIRRYYKTEAEQKKALKLFQQYLKKNYSITFLIERIKENPVFIGDELTAPNDLLMEAMAVAYADGEFSESEVAVVMKIAYRLGMSYYKYMHTLHLFQIKKKDGYYGDSTITSDDEDLHTLQKYNEYGTHDFNQYGMGHWKTGADKKKKWEQTDYRFMDEGYQSNTNQNTGSNYSGSSRQSSSYTSVLESEYKTLGITSSATDDQVSTAWKKLISKWHPDRYESMGAEAVRNATENSKIINEAYNNICKARGMS